MARRTRRTSKPPYDLFGEIPVTWPDVDAWCWAVAGLPPHSWRRRYYIEHWNVPEKIRAAKLSGAFHRIIAET